MGIEKNKENSNTENSFTKQREEIGHSLVEIIGGLVLGTILALFLKYFIFFVQVIVLVSALSRYKDTNI